MGGTDDSYGGCSRGWSLLCDKCVFTAIKMEVLKTHLEAVQGDGVYQCNKCDQRSLIFSRSFPLPTTSKGQNFIFPNNGNFYFYRAVFKRELLPTISFLTQ